MADLRGGKRPGAGRKPSGKVKVQFWVTPEEAECLELKLSEQRGEITVPKSEFETEIAELKYQLSLEKSKYEMKLHTLQIQHKDDIEQLEKKYESYSPPPIIEPVIQQCPECGKELKLRHRGFDKKPFMGCSGFPNCKYAKDV